VKALIAVALLQCAVLPAHALNVWTLHIFPFLAETIEDNWPTPLRYVGPDGLEDEDCGDRPVVLVSL
jgi:hypothetical protein